MADEQDKTQNDEAAKPAKPARAPRKPAAKPAAQAKAAGVKPAGAKAKPAGGKAKAADTKDADVKAAAAKADKPASAESAEAAAKPARRRVKPAATTDSAPATEAAGTAAPAKPARKRAVAAKETAETAPAATPAAAAKPPRARAAKPAERPVVHRAPEERTATIVDAAGKRVDEVKLSVDRFGVATDINLLHLAVRAEQAARRRGTASTRTRGEISGSTAKLYRQKGTGRARAGSVKSPTRSGGGTAFGPKPRSYDLKINRKAARKALAMALSDRAEGGTVYVARGLELEAPSTATVDDLLVALDIAAPVLVVTDDEPVIAKSVRNLRYAEAGEARRLSVEQVLRNRSIVVTEKALSVLTGA